MKPTSVKFGTDYIKLFDSAGEVVYWDKQEWVDDPELVFSIANACYLAASGVNIRAYLVSKGVNPCA